MPNLYICIDRFLHLNQINIQQQQQKMLHESGKEASERSTWKT